MDCVGFRWAVCREPFGPRDRGPSVVTRASASMEIRSGGRYGAACPRGVAGAAVVGRRPGGWVETLARDCRTGCPLGGGRSGISHHVSGNLWLHTPQKKWDDIDPVGCASCPDALFDGAATRYDEGKAKDILRETYLTASCGSNTKRGRIGQLRSTFVFSN